MLTIDVVIDEIGLEGSDGITLECLIERLKRHNYDKEFSEDEIKSIFRGIVRDKELEYRYLHSPRFLPQIFERRKDWNPNLEVSHAAS